GPKPAVLYPPRRRLPGAGEFPHIARCKHVCVPQAFWTDARPDIGPVAAGLLAADAECGGPYRFRGEDPVELGRRNECLDLRLAKHVVCTCEAVRQRQPRNLLRVTRRESYCRRRPSPARVIATSPHP